MSGATIQFNEIPSTTRVPGAYIEIDSSSANQQTAQNARVLVVGQRRSTGSVAALVPTLVTSYQQAIDNFGVGSMLAVMLKSVLANNNNVNEIWAIALDDESGGTAAAGSIVINSAATAAGTIYLYLGGELVTVSVASGDTIPTIQAAIVAAINANTELPVTAVAVNDDDDDTITVTFRHKGLVGNKFDMRANYRGALAGEVYPAGVTLTFTQLTSGATDPDVADAYAALPDETFDYVILPYIGSANLDATDTEMDDRWLGTRMLEGHAFVADKGSVSTIGTLGNGRNNQHMSLFDAGTNSPTPPYIWVSALGAAVAREVTTRDPAVPFNGVQLEGILPPPATDRRTQSERNTLLFDGVATHKINSDGKVYVERLTTTYQKNSEDITDWTYLDANTPFTLSYLRQSLRSRLSTKFARFKLADDGTQTVGQTTTTPSGIKAEIVAWALEMASLGLIEDVQNFISTIEVVRDESDTSRVNVLIRPDLVNQLQVTAIQVKFSL